MDNNGNCLSRQDILDSDDRKIERVETPEFKAGSFVYVRSLSSVEWDEYETSLLVRKGQTASVNTQNMRAKLAARAICNEQGEAIFSTEDVQRLGQKSAAAMKRIYDVARRLSGTTEAEIEAIRKNSETGQIADSVSVSA